MMSHRSWCSGGLRGGGWKTKRARRERAVIYQSSRQSCGEWQFNEESLFVFWFKIILSPYLHDYFPVMHFAGSGLEYNTTIVHLIINYRRREECKSGGGSRAEELPIIISPYAIAIRRLPVSPPKSLFHSLNLVDG